VILTNFKSIILNKKRQKVVKFWVKWQYSFKNDDFEPKTQ